MTPDLRRHAIDRIVAWTKWFSESGYNRDEPIANYYMGYFGAVAFGGIASEGDDPRAADLLKRAQRMYNAEIVPAYQAKLAGGDFPEGWQYGDMVGAILALFADAESRPGAGTLTVRTAALAARGGDLPRPRAPARRQAHVRHGRLVRTSQPSRRRTRCSRSVDRPAY